ncbi:MAG: BamA/TamA family outer membrane protein [Polyangiaceae bacterium]
MAGPCLLLALAACRPLPPEPLVDAVRVDGTRAVNADKLREGLATSDTPLLFGIFPRILEYSTFDANVLARDLERIERYLRARGYYEGKVVAARVLRTGAHSVRVEIEVQEGRPVRVERIDPGLSTLPLDVMLDVNRARRMADGDVFDEALFEQDRQRIERVLLDAGYAFGKVTAKANVNIAAHSAHLVYRIEAGQKARYGRVSIVGLEEIPEGPVRDNLGLREGDVYSESELEDAERALVDLGVFASVEVRPDCTHPETATVPILVSARESALRALRLGGGARFDVLRLSASLATSWEHRNFSGGMRRFSVSARPGVTFFPTRIGRFEGWTNYLPEAYVTTELRQPSFLEGRTTGRLNLQFSGYPLLYPYEGSTPEAEPILGYFEVKAAASVQRAFFEHHLQIAPSYNWQANFPYYYQNAQPTKPDNVIVSFPELVTTLSFVDDPVDTHSGVVLSNSLQVAGHGFGGNVSDVRIAPEVKAYLPVRKAVLAARVGFGFLFPSGYGDVAFRAGRNVDARDPTVIADQQKLLFRGFYSGGPSSNRGYAYRGVGPQGPIGFLLPTGQNCNFNDAGEVPSSCILPLGGMTLWEASIEARIPFPLSVPLWGVVFVDASDLTSNVGQLRLDAPHLSPGLGLRYMTPIGALRLDVGYRVPGAQQPATSETSSNYARPPSELFGFFPGAVHLAIGQAY